MGHYIVGQIMNVLISLGLLLGAAQLPMGNVGAMAVAPTVNGSRAEATPKCSRKSQAISEAKAVSLAMEEILRIMGTKEALKAENSDVIAIFDNRSREWWVTAMPKTREIDAHITVVMNKCGSVLKFKSGV